MTKLQKQLAENIRFYRKKKGMTQENLAEKVGTATNLLEGLKTATKLVLLFLMRVFSKLAYQPLFSLETARYALVAKALRCEIAFSAIQKLKLFSLLKIKERLK